MRPDDLETLRKIQWNHGAAFAAYEPWVKKMRPADRMLLRGSGGSPPGIPELEWHYAVTGLWIGRLPANANPPRMERQNNPVWITGAGGLIGNYLVQTAPKFAPQRRVRALTRDQLDLLDFAAVRREFEKDKPQLVIHCAAISTAIQAQKDPIADAAGERGSHKTTGEVGGGNSVHFLFHRSGLRWPQGKLRQKPTHRIRCISTAKPKLWRRKSF